MPRAELPRDLDVLVIGTGAGGAPLLARLASAGLKVAALEAGVRHPPEQIATDEVAQAGIFWMDERLSAGGGETTGQSCREKRAGSPRLARPPQRKTHRRPRAATESTRVSWNNTEAVCCTIPSLLVG